MTAPLVSVVLPTYQGRADLDRLLPALGRQTLWPRAELVSIDSSSTDGTLAALEAFGASVTRIEQRDFGHGRTRNQAVERSRGTYVVFLSQDSIPRDDDFLERLVEPLADATLGGVSARVLPEPDCDLLTARTVLDLPEAGDQPRRWQIAPRAGLWQFSGPERARLLRFNNVASAARREVLLRYPFPELEFGEDFAFASRVLTAGFSLGFEPSAVALHGHRYGPRAAFARYRTDARFHAQAHGWRLRPSLASALRGLAFELRQDLAFARGSDGFLQGRGTASKFRDLFRAPVLRAAQIAGQWRGSLERPAAAPPRALPFETA